MASQEECMQWCENNLDKISKYNQYFLAISLVDGIIIAEANEKVFLRRVFDEVPQSKRENVFLTHSFAFGFGYDNPSTVRQIATSNMKKAIPLVSPHSKNKLKVV